MYIYVYILTFAPKCVTALKEGLLRFSSGDFYFKGISRTTNVLKEIGENPEYNDPASNPLSFILFSD